MCCQAGPLSHTQLLRVVACLLQVIAAGDALGLDVRLAAAVNFKNLIKYRWVSSTALLLQCTTCCTCEPALEFEGWQPGSCFYIACAPLCMLCCTAGAQ